MKTFQEIPLLKAVQRALADEQYETPTPIQAQAIPPALSGRDVLGCAQTGTGKTAAFALPVLHQLGSQKIKARPNQPLALVLAPTRELAIQIGESFETYGRHLHLRHTLVYGGVGQHKQVRALNRGVHILVATPGRLLDLINQGYISLEQLRMFVLDEADRMLDMGFLPDLKRIIKLLPERRQSLFFSATLSPNIISLTDQLLRDPLQVNVAPAKAERKQITQSMLFLEPSEKQSVLEKILRETDVVRTLVFTKTKRGADKLVQQLGRQGINSVAIHGNKSQNARQRALEGFRNNRTPVLVATDVAARGIDVDGVSHVINYDLPMEAESYVHRIGRTGRAGADGVAISFCGSGDRKQLRMIENLLEHKIPVDPDYPAKNGGRSGNSSPKRGGPKPGRRRRPDSGASSPNRETSFSNFEGKTPGKRRSRKNVKRFRRDKQTT